MAGRAARRTQQSARLPASLLRRGATARVKVAEKSHPASSAASLVAAHVGKKSVYLVLNEI